MKNKKYLLGCIVILIITPICLFCQSSWELVNYGFKETVEYLPPLEDSRNYNVDYCYPGLEKRGALILLDSVMTQNQKENSLFYELDLGYDNLYYEMLSLPEPQVISVGATKFKMEFHSENVADLYILCYDSKRDWVYFNYRLEGSGFQEPIRNSVKSWSAQKNGHLMFVNDLNVERIAIAYTKVEDDDPSALTIAECGFYAIENYRSSIVASWIDSLVGNRVDPHLFSSISYSNWVSSQMNVDSTTKTLFTFGDYLATIGNQTQIVEFRNELQSTRKERQFMDEVVQEFIEKYSYYDVKGIDKTEVAQKWKNLRSEFLDGEFNLSIELLKKFIYNEFRDPHFSVFFENNASAETNYSKGPIRLYDFGTHVEVVANFNAELIHKLPLGSIVHSINNETISEIIESTTQINDILMAPVDSDIQVVFYQPGRYMQLDTVVVSYDIEIVIDGNYIPRHGEFRELNNSTLYYRINNWRGDAFYSLLNNLESINNSKGLVIDLRNNGGGYGRDCYNTISIFLNEPMVLCDIEYENGIKESNVVLPARKEYRIVDSVPLIVLVNEGTACSSELFLIGLQNRPNTLVVGTASTMGAISGPTLFRFPSGTIIRYPYFNAKSTFKNQYFIEGGGIQPDYKVSQTHYEDLYPYNDKVLKVAERFFAN